MTHRKRDQSHEDAEDAIQAARDANPFTARNAVIGVAIALATAAILALVAFFFNTLLTSQSRQEAALQEVASKMGETHDTQLVQGTKLDGVCGDIASLKSDVSTLRANCMTREKVDSEIRHLIPQSMNDPIHGGENMIEHAWLNSTALSTNKPEPFQ